MKKASTIKVEKSSNYWVDFEGDSSVYYHIKWNSKAAIEYFNKTYQEFIQRYIQLTNKFRLAITLNKESNSALDEILLSNFYLKDNNYIYPSELFLDSNSEKADLLISIDPKLTLIESNKRESSHGSIPLRVELLVRESEIKILCYIDNDIFNLSLDNKKCAPFEYPIDNSDLAYLNTPRLNSFLRDLKKLCFEFGASDFEFEDLGLYDFCEDGVKFGEEVVYYEDIVEMLKPHQRIVQ